jgi:hypothetical protein
MTTAAMTMVAGPLAASPLQTNATLASLTGIGVGDLAGALLAILVVILAFVARRRASRVSSIRPIPALHVAG